MTRAASALELGAHDSIGLLPPAIRADPRLEVCPITTEQLRDGGVLLYDESFLPPALADRYFTELRDELAWEHKPGIFGYMQPRLTASYGAQASPTATQARKMSHSPGPPHCRRSRQRSKRFKVILISAC